MFAIIGSGQGLRPLFVVIITVVNEEKISPYF